MIDEYLTLSYSENFKCWDLVRLFFKRELGIEIGPVEDQSEHIKHGSWVLVDNIVPFDVLLFRTGSDPHVGVVLYGNRFLHIRNGQTACIERFTGTKWKHKLKKAYRHKQLVSTAN